MTKEEYIDGVLELHAQGTIDAYNDYRLLSQSVRLDGETESQYIIRLAGIDYDDSIYHELALQFYAEMGLELC